MKEKFQRFIEIKLCCMCIGTYNDRCLSCCNKDNFKAKNLDKLISDLSDKEPTFEQ